MGEALSRDGRGRPLPVWQGCHVVGADELFLMNWQSADSLDGRYFGFVPTSPSSARRCLCGPGRSDRDRKTLKNLSFLCSVECSTIPPSRPSLHGRRAQRRSRAAARPARQRFTLDGREHDGSLAISRGDGVHGGDFRIIDAVQHGGACRASIVGDASSERSTHRSLGGFCHRGIQTVRCPGALDTLGDARRECWRSAGAIAKRRHGTDADHAADVVRVARSIWSWHRSLRSPTTTFWLAPHTSANSTIDMARRVSSPPTMQDLHATRTHLATGRSLPDETQDYVATLAPMIGGKQVNGKIVAVADSLDVGTLTAIRCACCKQLFGRSPIG